MGSEMTEGQEAQLAPFGTLIVAMDSDLKGKEAAEKISTRLKMNHKIIKATLKEG